MESFRIHNCTANLGTASTALIASVGMQGAAGSTAAANSFFNLPLLFLPLPELLQLYLQRLEQRLKQRLIAKLPSRR